MKQSIDRLFGARLLSRQAVLGFGMAAAVVAGIAACGGNNNPVCPNLPIADGLIGQTAYNISPVSSLDGVTLAGPKGSVGITLTNSNVPVNIMYVADTFNNRVLAFSPVPANAINTTPASFAIGQQDVKSNTSGTQYVPGTTQGIGLSGPTKASVSSDGTKLVVTDSSNNRVLIWNSLPLNNSTAPDVIIGQPNATTNVNNNNAGFSATQCNFATVSGGVTYNYGGPSQCSLNGPTSAVIAGTKLIVADKGNSRVLIWNIVPTVSGAPADLELGQPVTTTSSGGVPANPTGFTAGNGSIDTVIGTSTYVLNMNQPTDVWSSGGALAVSDTTNNRVLYWTNIPSISNSISGAYVIGQATFGAQNSGSGSTKLSGPTGVVGSGQYLYVGDTQNNRVLQFPVGSVANGVTATGVFGQQDFSHTAYNDTDQNNQAGNQDNGQSNLLPGQNVLYNPQGVAVSDDATQIYVTDTGNSRIMQFAINSAVNGTYTNNCNGVNPQL